MLAADHSRIKPVVSVKGRATLLDNPIEMNYLLASGDFEHAKGMLSNALTDSPTD
jgi:hypothetical protein